MKTLVLEHTAPFQGLPELVADAEGLFAKEGLKIEWADTDDGASREARTDLKSPLSAGCNTQSLMIYVDDVDAHCARARAAVSRTSPRITL